MKTPIPELQNPSLDHYVRIKTDSRRTVFERGLADHQQLIRKSGDISNNHEACDYAGNQVMNQQPLGVTVLLGSVEQDSSMWKTPEIRDVISPVIARSHKRRVIRLCGTAGVLPQRTIVRRRKCVLRLSAPA